jgi:hypothetical protein
MITKALVNENNEVINTAVFGDEEIDGNWIEYTEANLAHIGGTYENGFFYSPQPYPSWIKNTEIHDWEAPTPMPTDGGRYKWVEDDLNWQLLESGA